jgi:hypothetical protein
VPTNFSANEFHRIDAKAISSIEGLFLLYRLYHSDQRIAPPQALLTVELHERSDNLVEITLDDLVQLVKSQIDSVIGQTILRKIIRPNSLTSISRTNQRPSL